MPVPRVVTSTRPGWPWPRRSAPRPPRRHRRRSSGRCRGRARPRRPSRPGRRSRTCRCWPPSGSARAVTTAGMVMPIGPSPMSSAKCSTISRDDLGHVASGSTWPGCRSATGLGELARWSGRRGALDATAADVDAEDGTAVACHSGGLSHVRQPIHGLFPARHPGPSSDAPRRHWVHELRHHLRQPYGRRPRRRDLRPAGHAPSTQRVRRLRQRPRGAGTDTGAALGRGEVRDADADRAAVQDLERGRSSSTSRPGSPGGTSAATSGAICSIRSTTSTPG